MNSQLQSKHPKTDTYLRVIYNQFTCLRWESWEGARTHPTAMAAGVNSAQTRRPGRAVCATHQPQPEPLQEITPIDSLLRSLYGPTFTGSLLSTYAYTLQFGEPRPRCKSG